MNPRVYTDVAPQVRTSVVFARVRVDATTTNTAVAAKMIPIRAARFVTALRAMIGTNSRATMSQAMIERVAIVIADPVRTKKWSS